MFWFKNCPKCENGDLYDAHDHHGRIVSCLQCGHHLTEVEQAVVGYVTPTPIRRPYAYANPGNWFKEGQGVGEAETSAANDPARRSY